MDSHDNGTPVDVSVTNCNIQALSELPDKETPLTKPKYVLTVPGVAILLAKGYSPTAIAEVFNVSTSAVCQFLNRHADRLHALRNSEEMMSMKIKDKMLDIVESISEDDIKKAGLSGKMISLGIGVEKSRLLDGKSTQNISTLSKIICDLDTLDPLITPQDVVSKPDNAGHNSHNPDGDEEQG